MHAVRAGHHRDVQVVVDDEERAGGRRQLAEADGNLEELAAGKLLVAELNNVSPTAQGATGEVHQRVWIAVGGDHVEPRGLKPCDQLRIWRSFSRKAGGAVSHSQECLTSRLRWAWNS